MIEQHGTEPTMKFDDNGNMTEWAQGEYLILIERAPDGGVAFWTDSHGSSGTAEDLPVYDDKLIFIDCPPLKFPVFDIQQLMASQPDSVKWCFDPRLMPQGKVPEAECPCCGRPISKCTCNNS